MIRGCDIFCGAGGSSAGAKSAGVSIVAGIDMCATATETFAANFPGAHVETSRLEEVDMVDFKSKVGSIDILLASPECRNHTCAKGSAPRDESSRATAMQVVEYARALRPRLARSGERHPHAPMVTVCRTEEPNPGSRVFSSKSTCWTRRTSALHSTAAGLFLVCDRARKPELVIPKRPGRRKTAKSILDPADDWKTSALYDERRAAATLERASRGFQALGEEASFLLVYYSNDGEWGVAAPEPSFANDHDGGPFRTGPA